MDYIPEWAKVYFTRKELACHCCGELNISEDFLYKLVTARKIAGIPFLMTSVCRCKKHNLEVTKKKDSHSKHRTDTIPNGTEAGDITARNDSERGIISRALFLAGIQQIGINIDDKFIHCEEDSGYALWVY